MPRKKVTTTFRRVERAELPSPPCYRAASPESRMSALTRYIADNEDSGLTRQELIEQFQEYDCSHKARYRKTVTFPSGKRMETCSMCGKVDVILPEGEDGS